MNRKQPFQKLLAVDPSLTCSGWTLFDFRTELPIAIGEIKGLGTKLPLAERLADIQMQIEELQQFYALGESDVLICEGPAPLIKNPDSASKVEQVRSIFETVARSRLLTVPGRINPRTLQTELLGMKGSQLGRKEVKLWARATAKQLFDKELSAISQLPFDKISQDIIDSTLIGCLSISTLKRAQAGGTSAAEALEPGQKTKWGYSRSKGKQKGWTEADLKRLS